MPKNRFLPDKTATDIDGHIERVLRGLGNPDPPLELSEVRELLKLDRAFYTADDPGATREMVSRIRVGAAQIIRRPTLLIDAIRKASLKALYLPDRKRILLDGDLPEKKHRWNEAHEIGHSLIPWHHDVMFGDDEYTLTVDCHEQIEAEANFAAGRLLFLRERFVNEALAKEPSIKAVQQLNKIFKNTLSTTLYRLVECADIECPLVGLITAHPYDMWGDPSRACRHFIRSPAFARRFGRISEAELLGIVAGYCGAQRGGPLGEAEIELTDNNGLRHYFFFETFFNGYDALTLGKYLHPKHCVVSVSK